jgi:heat-inducible transcriptional repressor
LSPERVCHQELKIIDNLFVDEIYELEEVVQNSAKVLSDLTKYTAIVLGPTVKENKLSRFQIVPLNEETAMAIIVTNTGHIEHKMFTLPKSIDASDIEKTVNILNNRLIGVPLNELHSKLMNEVITLLKEHIDHYDLILSSLSSVLNVSANEKLYYSGKINMLKQPEFQNIEKVTDLLKLIEEENDVYRLLRETPFGINVKIGTENKLAVMEDCSFITATYNIGDEQVGAIAILGPKRMNYSRVISLVNLLSENLTFSLTNLYNQ